MKKLLLSIVFVTLLLAGAFLLPTTASAHATTTTGRSIIGCTYILTPVSKTTTSIVVHINDCLAQALGTIGILPLATLIANAGVEPGLASAMAGAMIANRQLLLGIDLSCSGRGVTISYDPLLGTHISAAC